MKKFLLIIFLFFCCINVNAQERKFAGSEYLQGVSYVKYDGKTHYYRNAQVIRDVDTGELAYCVEPFKLLVDNTSYSNSSYSNYGISDEVWNKIKLYAYYGYGYGFHTNLKWITVTQMSIWRAIYPNYQFDWIDSVDSKNIINPYSYEVMELNELVNNHYKLPNLNSNYTIDVNGVLTLKDSNKVLKYYDVVSSDFKVDKVSNSIVISAGEELKEGTINLRRAGSLYDNSIEFFYSSSSQNVVKRGNIDSIDFEIKIKVQEGKITVNKVNNESQLSSTSAELDGAIFELLDSDMNFLKESIVKDNIAIFNNLSFGKYYVREKVPGNGYYLNEEVYEVIIDENEVEKEITIGNNLIKSNVKITKYYGSLDDYHNNKMKKESDITFLIYDNRDNLLYEEKTDKEGTIEILLPYGEYVIKQKNTTNGYKVADDYYLSINNESLDNIDINLYDFKIEVPNARISLFKFFKHLLDNYFA